MKKAKAKILIVDDESDIRMLLSGILEDENYAVLEAKNAEICFHLMMHDRPDLVILDIWLEGSHLDGLQILKLIKKDYPEIPVIMISGHGTIETAVESLKLGAYDFIEKPFKSDKLLHLLKNALEHKILRTQNKTLIEQVKTETSHYLQGISSEAKQINKQIAKMTSSGCKSNILITAPPGSGKAFFAHHIHQISERKNEAFIELHCNMLNANQNWENELFSHLQKADKGTLHLIEFTELSLEIQKKLASLIQKKTFLPPNAKVEIPFDVRFIGSTNLSLQRLEKLIEEEKLLSDFYYRLNMMTLAIPSLKERRKDIIPYFDALSENIARRKGCRPITLDEEARALIELYSWPGNLRQLENMVDALYLTENINKENKITPQHLPKELLDTQLNTSKWQEEQDILSLPLKEAREKFEHDYLKMQLERFEGNISYTAQFIGMERSALHRKLKALGIEIEKKNLAGLNYIIAS